MRKIPILSFLALIGICSTQSFAQGGIGTTPREDLVKLRATVRDSLNAEIHNKVLDLKRYVDAGQLDSITAIIAHNGGATKEGKWARTVSMTNPDEATRVTALQDKITKLYKEFSAFEGKYYAIFKNADNPYGQQHLYQMEFTDGGKKRRKVSFTFYPVGEKMLLGDVQ